MQLSFRAAYGPPDPHPHALLKVRTIRIGFAGRDDAQTSRKAPVPPEADARIAASDATLSRSGG